VKVYQVDAFTDQPFLGNPAGVVPDAAGLPEDLMQAIAREMNCSETAFVGAGGEAADLRIRYFTPETEVDLCGHATIASLHLLRELGRLEADCRLRVRTRAGTIEAGLRAGQPYMVQNPLQVRPCPEDPGPLLGLGPADRDGDAVLAYTGLWHVLVPVRHADVLARLEPDLARLAHHNRALGAVTTHVFAIEGAPAGVDVCARDFAPAVGVAEDPQTGTASGAMGAWLVATGRLPGPAMLALQGTERPGRVAVRVEGSRVEVGGTAVTVLEGRLRVRVTSAGPGSCSC
jgi:trans-2,3-dihydro-3-hydroxyanthranilate isomerase